MTVNPVTDGGPLATRDVVDWQDLAFLFIRACALRDVRDVRARPLSFTFSRYYFFFLSVLL